MPSLQDVADQINARLDQVSTHTANTAQNTADLLVVSQNIRNELDEANGRLGQIDNTLLAGFANVSQGLFALIQVQLAALDLLDHHRKQNDTIICELTHSNQLLCNLMRKTGQLVSLDEASLVAVQRIEGIEARAHADEAGDFDRDLEMRRRIERCCPPPTPPLEPCPESCKVPTYKERQPPGRDWKPLPEPREPNPVG